MFKKLFQIFSRKSEVPQQCSESKENKSLPSDTEICEPDSMPTISVTSDCKIPFWIGTAQKYFQFDMSCNVTDESALLASAEQGQWDLIPELIEGEYHLFAAGQDIGILTEHAACLKMWMRKSAPYRITLKHYESNSGCTVTLTLYRDYIAENSWMDSDIVALQAYKSKAKQEAIEGLSPGERCEFVEKSKWDNELAVSHFGDQIGRIPKKIATRYYDEGAAHSVFYIDHEYESNASDDIVLRPKVQIFWNSDNSDKEIRIENITSREKLIDSVDEYSVVDVETTGLDARTSKIIEIAIVRVKDGQIVEEYSTLVNPGQRILSFATEINGIHDSDVVDSPDYCDIAGDVARLLIGTTVIAHNASFDLRFIKELLDLNCFSGNIQVIDTVAYAKRAVRGLPSYKLSALIDYFHLEGQNSHRALDDVMATQQLFERCRVELSRIHEEEKAKRKEAKLKAEAERKEKYSRSPLFNVSFVFIGEFDFGRDQLEERTKNVGACIRTSVTSRTNYLIEGKPKDSADWPFTVNHSEATRLIEEGKRIQIISEAELILLLEAAENVLSTVNPPVSDSDT